MIIPLTWLTCNFVHDYHLDLTNLLFYAWLSSSTDSILILCMIIILTWLTCNFVHDEWLSSWPDSLIILCMIIILTWPTYNFVHDYHLDLTHLLFCLWLSTWLSSWPDSMLGLSMAWQAKRSPKDPKKSLPRKGKPGLVGKCCQKDIPRKDKTMNQAYL